MNSSLLDCCGVTSLGNGTMCASLSSLAKADGDGVSSWSFAVLKESKRSNVFHTNYFSGKPCGEITSLGLLDYINVNICFESMCSVH